MNDDLRFRSAQASSDEASIDGGSAQRLENHRAQVDAIVTVAETWITAPRATNSEQFGRNARQTSGQ